MKKGLSMFGSFVFFILLGLYLFTLLSPQFGGRADVNQQKEYEKAGYYKNRKFQNIEEFSLKHDCHSVTEMLKKIFKGTPGSEPPRNIDVVLHKPDAGSEKKSIHVVWLGHSSLLIEIGKVKY